MVFFSFLFSLLFSLSLFGQGFVAGTLVKTSYGYLTIEKLRPGDTVISYDLKGSCLECPITHISQNYTESVTELTIGSEKLYVAPDHTFYLPLEKQWREARLLKQHDILLKSCTELITLDAIDIYKQDAVVFDLTVDHYHNFCVSRHDITAHNVAVVIPIFTYVFGEGIAWFAGAATAIGAGLFYNAVQKVARDQGADIHFYEINNHDYDNNFDKIPPQGPNEPNDPNKKDTHRQQDQEVPEKAYNMMGEIRRRKGSPPPNHKGGGAWNNDGRHGSQKLPDHTKYRKYDLDIPQNTGKRNLERLVFGEDGSVYYTRDHYKTFVRIK